MEAPFALEYLNPGQRNQTTVTFLISFQQPKRFCSLVYSTKKMQPTLPPARIHNNTDRKDNRNMQTNNESKQNQKKR